MHLLAQCRRRYAEDAFRGTRRDLNRHLRVPRHSVGCRDGIHGMPLAGCRDSGGVWLTSRSGATHHRHREERYSAGSALHIELLSLDLLLTCRFNMPGGLFLQSNGVSWLRDTFDKLDTLL